MDSRRKVFLLDGDIDARKQLSRISDLMGIEFEAFATADEFLNRDMHGLGHPCCLVLEVNLPGENGNEVYEKLVRRNLAIPVLFVTSAGDVPTVVQAMQAGALSYVQKPIGDDRLIELILQALALSARRTTDQAEKDAVRARVAKLSKRERAVFELLVNGKSNKEIAVQLGIGVPMVTRHRSRVLQKLEVCNTVQLARLARSYI